MDPVVNCAFHKFCLLPADPISIQYTIDCTMATSLSHPSTLSNPTTLTSPLSTSIPSRRHTVAKITQSILEREAEARAYASAELYIDRRDAKPAAADVIVDVEQGDSQELTAVRLVLRPDGHRTSPASFTGMAPSKSQLAML
jgi:hypothetical protein